MRTWAFSFSDRGDELKMLQNSIESELLRRDTESPVFHGSTDWHSAVHGHWASLWLARALRQPERRESTLSRLRGAKMQREFEYLERHPDFERPYGRAWLLRLGLLMEEMGVVTHRAHLEACAAGLLVWLKTATDPHLGEYENPCWVVIQLHAWSLSVGDAKAVSECKEWMVSSWERFLGCPSDDVHRGEFLSIWGVQSLAIGTILGPVRLKEWLASREIGEFEPVCPLQENVHHLGIHASRAWGCATAYAATMEERWRHAYLSHLQASLILHRQWAHDSYSYAHWVPQFTVYAFSVWDDGSPMTSGMTDEL